MKHALVILVLLLFLASCAFQVERSWYADESEEFKAWQQMEEWLIQLEKEQETDSRNMWPDVFDTVTRC